MTATAAVKDSDLELIFVLIAIFALCVALYCGYIRNLPGAAIAILVALVLFVIAL